MSYKTIGNIREHRLIVEGVIGKPLLTKHIVHHVDGIKDNNENSNLVVCEDRAYHNLLHTRMKAKEACGNPSWRSCVYCHVYDSLDNMVHNKSSRHYYHSKCSTEYQRGRRHGGI